MHGDLIDRVSVPDAKSPDHPEYLYSLYERATSQKQVAVNALRMIEEAIHPAREPYLWDIVQRAIEKCTYEYHEGE